MCGVVGILGPAGALDREALALAVHSLHHRGPDGHGVWTDAARRVGLGHARLSIIDLAGGAQPLANEDETIHAVVNGELYDFERQRAELEVRGHRFRTRSDSEVLVHLYEEYGARCVDHLRGEVAFILWDARNQVLLAGRDRFGIKPLYYADDGRTLLLASEVKALFAAGVRAAWDVESLFQALSTGATLADRSLFAGVRQVPPGHYLFATAQHRSVARYWDLDFPVEPAPDGAARADREHVEALSSVIDEAIRLRLRADVAVGIYLSGGLDSCSLLGMTTRLAAAPPHAFTIAFDHPAYDELGIAREMANHAGAPLTPVPVTAGDIAADFSKAVLHAETFFNNTNGVAKYRLSRAVRDAGYKVVLTGEGADEILAGYPHFRRDLLLASSAGRGAEVGRQLTELDRKNAISRGILMPDGDSLPLERVRAVLGGAAPTWMEALATAGAKVRALLSADLLASLGARDPYLLFAATLDVDRVRARHPVHQAQYLWAKTGLPSYILTVLGDRMEMAHSVEGRVPFLDHRVAELAVRMPLDLKIRGTTEKHVLREAARPVITDTVYRRQKHPFFGPPAATTPGTRLNELAQDVVRTSIPRMPFFDARAVAALLDRVPAMNEDTRSAVDPVVVAMLSLALLHDGFALGT